MDAPTRTIKKQYKECIFSQLNAIFRLKQRRRKDARLSAYGKRFRRAAYNKGLFVHSGQISTEPTAACSQFRYCEMSTNMGSPLSIQRQRLSERLLRAASLTALAGSSKEYV